MTPHQKIVSFLIAAALLAVVLELVRRRTLRVEYSWVWIVAVAGLLALILSPSLLAILTDWVGAVDPSTTIFIFAFVFLVLICIHFSVKISELTSQVKKLTQQLAILEAEKTELEKRAPAASETKNSREG